MTRIDTDLAGNTRADRAVYAAARALVVGLCRVWCRITVEGRDRVPKQGAFLLAPVHRSILDTPISAAVTRRRLRFMGADKYWKSKRFGRLLSALGGFPVTRGTADREALQAIVDRESVEATRRFGTVACGGDADDARDPLALLATRRIDEAIGTLKDYVTITYRSQFIAGRLAVTFEVKAANRPP